MCINKIKNVREAKKYFFACGCSHFHMAREYPERYSEYTKLGVIKEQENQWKKEYIKNEFDEAMNSQDDREIYSHIFRITEVMINNFIDLSNLELLYEAITIKLNVVDSFTKILFSESIVRVIKKTNKNTSDLFVKLRDLALSLSMESINNPTDISASTKNVNYLSDILDESKIIERANRVAYDCRAL
jgi:hypothetical protein